MHAGSMNNTEKCLCCDAFSFCFAMSLLGVSFNNHIYYFKVMLNLPQTSFLSVILKLANYTYDTLHRFIAIKRKNYLNRGVKCLNKTVNVTNLCSFHICGTEPEVSKVKIKPAATKKGTACKGQVRQQYAVCVCMYEKSLL